MMMISDNDGNNNNNYKGGKVTRAVGAADRPRKSNSQECLSHEAEQKQVCVSGLDT